MAPKHAVFWGTFLVLLALDQATKWWVWTNLAYRVDEIVVIPGFLSIVHAQNPGAAFGLLDEHHYRYLLFGVFTVVVVLIILDLYRRLPGRERMMAASLGLILSGAVGNAIDRAVKRTVTDFVRVYTDDPTLAAWLRSSPLGSNEWPIFNVADAALLLGVLVFLVHAMFVDEEEPVPAPPDPGDGGGA